MAQALLEQIKQGILDENEELVKESVKKALAAKVSAYDILMKGLQPALIASGAKYEKNQFFLTDLMMVGDITTAVMEVLTPLLKAQKAKSAGKVVIGTVEGDVHNIGKSIVSSVLTGAGYEVYDIGEDQPAKNFVSKTQELKADIVGASAILGGAKFHVGEINEELKKAGIRDKVGLICGGWGFTENVAKGFGADHCGDDAWDALRKTDELMKKLGKKAK
ncbi:MAG: cobalamin-dependent protein [Candidatus Atabeyarchaeum deiterrae]